MTDFLIKRDELGICRLRQSEVPVVGAGQALLRVERFGLTANNITYAVMGDAMSYWDFFPAPQGWGRMPVWGFAEVERSETPGVEPGMRFYGYLPPSSYLLVAPAPADVDATGFVDGAGHRAPLASAYQRYLATATDPFYSATTEDVQMLLRPLFVTSFLIDDLLDDEGLVARGPILVSSASSKTAIAAAYLLSRRKGVRLVGLTSPGNAKFVAGLGIYDSTVTYAEIGSLPRGPATYVDIAGDAAVRKAVHAHHGDDLALSMAVGLAHHEGFGADVGEIAGPRPTLFFAPERVSRRTAEWGQAGFDQRVAEAWHPFCEWSASWLHVIRSSGFEGLRDAYLEVLSGDGDPRSAHVIADI
jgi:hypothetical protein